MEKITLKKTLNLHKYNLRVADIISNWKLILPIGFSVVGLVMGSCLAKGEGDVYLKISELIKQLLLNDSNKSVYASFIIFLLIPTVFAFAIFFSGLSIYGGIIANIIPAFFSFAVSIITYFFYSNYTLKGLAYCVIIIFPYAVLSLLSLILLTGESITMSQVLLKSLNKNFRSENYKFSFYYKNCLKSYIFIILATILKIIIDKLFLGIFVF